MTKHSLSSSSNNYSRPARKEMCKINWKDINILLVLQLIF